MTHHLDFWFDYSSPFAYLGSRRIEALVARAGATMAWRPMLLGAVFKAIGTPMVPLFELSAQKRAYLNDDMHRWARHTGATFQWPSRFPMNTVKPLRITLLLDPGTGDQSRFIHACFAAYWAEDRDISDPDVLTSILTAEGLPTDLVARTAEPEVKRRLIEATQAAVEAGVFGAPTSIVDGQQLFWGQDRFELVEKALGGWVCPSGAVG